MLSGDLACYQIFSVIFQKGDVLIVSYTDVGWSPYFPLISGLITEMGGLVSHGKLELRNV